MDSDQDEEVDQQPPPQQPSYAPLEGYDDDDDDDNDADAANEQRISTLLQVDGEILSCHLIEDVAHSPQKTHRIK